jgi:hypothetical protein
MIFERYFKLSEADRWQLETDVPWEAIDAERARRRPDLLQTLRDAALIESYAPMFALKSLHLWWDSVEESAVASIQFYEEYKHYVALQRYLEAVGCAIPEREIVEVRRKSYGTEYGDRGRQLANYMMSEHFTAHFYRRLLEKVEEPVLKTLLTHLMRDEVRHCNVFYALLQRRLELQPSLRETIVDEALHFRHQGVEVVGEAMPMAERNDFQTVLLFFRRVESLTGVSLRAHLKGLLRTAEAPGPR